MERDSRLLESLKTTLALKVVGEIGSLSMMKGKGSPVAPILKEYRRLYEIELNTVCVLSSATSAKFMLRALAWCAGDEKELTGIVRWMFEDWPRLARHLHWDGPPTLSLFGSATIFPRLKHAFHNPSVLTGTKDGASAPEHDASPADGWGE